MSNVNKVLKVLDKYGEHAVLMHLLIELHGIPSNTAVDLGGFSNKEKLNLTVSCCGAVILAVADYMTGGNKAAMLEGLEEMFAHWKQSIEDRPADLGNMTLN